MVCHVQERIGSAVTDRSGWVRIVLVRCGSEWTGKAVRDCRVVHRIVKECRGLAVMDCMGMVCPGRYRSGSRGPEV